MTPAPVSAQARQAQQLAVALVERDRALVQLVGLLDPWNSRSTWALSVEIVQLLNRFKGTPLQRIQQGHRSPRGSVEPLLLALVLGNTPTSARRLFDLVRELTGRVKPASPDCSPGTPENG